MHLSFSFIIEVLGTIAFTISGAYAAMQKKLDLFGVIMIAFVTAIGGGTIRDMLIGNTPVSWMKNMTTPLIILSTAVITIFFKQLVHNLKITLFLFDAVGLGLFTVVGIQKGLEIGLNPGVCIALGTITGCFGGVLRDILLSQIPVLFHKEIYATACIIGGTAYCVLIYFVNKQVAEAISVILICGIRILAVRLNWKLPAV